MKPGEVRRSSAGGEVGAHDVACSVFLARHSAYLDHDLLPRERQAHERHLESCESCARYARVLASGVDVLRSLPPIEASPDFEARLQHRLFHVQDEAALGARPRPGRAWLAAAAALALLVAGDRVMDGRTASLAEGRASEAATVSPSASAPAPATSWNLPARGVAAVERDVGGAWDLPAVDLAGWERSAWEAAVTALVLEPSPSPAATVLDGGGIERSEATSHSPAYSPVVVQPPRFRRVSATE